MRPQPINSLWIFGLAILHFAVALYFGYYFLFAEELYIGADKSVEDELVQDNQPPAWIKQVLSPSEPSQIIVSQPHSHYIFLDNYCNRTLAESKPKFSKFVMFVIDAFRVDFVPSILADSPNLYENPRLPYMEQIMKSHGIGLVSIASIPTVTLPRIKALISGTIPSFIDYIMNLSAYKFQSDNLVEQFWNQNKRVLFFGDDTWAKLFSPSIFHRCNVTSSLFATDYTEVDTNVTYNVNRELKNLNDWDVMITHYLGVDHIGHLRGYNSDLFGDKLAEMDNVFRSIFDALIYNEINSNDTYLIAIVGDHGMTNSGNHGGNTRDETHTALLFISTNKSHQVNSFATDQLDPSDKVSLQIDFASTVASLFGQKFPSKSQGRLISPVLERFGVGEDEHLCLLFRNAFQMQSIIMKKINEDSVSSSKVFDNLKAELIEALNLHYNFVNQEQSMDNRQNRQQYFQQAKSSYHRFIHQLQQQHLNKVQNRSIFSSLSLSIVFCFCVILSLLWLEFVYNRTASILAFDELFKNYPTIFEPALWFYSIYSIFGEDCRTKIGPTSRLNLTKLFSHLRYFSSCFGRLVVLVPFVLNFVLMGSTSFMEMEHWFWHYMVATILIAKVLVTIRGYLNFYRSNFKSPEIQHHYLKVICSLLVLIVIFKFVLLQWKIPIINEADLKRFDSSGTNSTLDIQTWLIRKESKHFLSAFFIASLIGIAFLTSKFRTANSDRFSSATLSRSFYIFVSGLFWIYLYRSQSGSVSVFRLPLIKKFFGRFGSQSANFYAQIVFFHLFILWCDCILKRTKLKHLKFLPNFLVQRLARLNRLTRSITNKYYSSSLLTARSNSIANSTSFLNTFQLSWILMSTLLLESSAVPVFMLNILIEKILNFVMSQPEFLQQLNQARGQTLDSTLEQEEEDEDFDNPQPIQYRQQFYRLLCYLALANSSFYQIGNTNSLSTVGVNACFVGLDSYQPVPCGIFMTISMFSSYIFWLVTFFVRLKQDLFRYNSGQQLTTIKSSTSVDNPIVEHYYSVSQLNQLRPETDQISLDNSDPRFAADSRLKHRIVQNYCTFYSVINLLLIIRMAILTQNMAITFMLRDHLFIWSVICPKFLYEMCFTIVSHVLICLMVLLFSLDNCFMLNCGRISATFNL